MTKFPSYPPLAAAVLAILLAGGCTSGNSNPERTTAKDQATARHSADALACQPLAGNFKDICMVEAKGRHDIALAEIKARFEPSDSNRRDVRIARANSDLAVAKERCDDFAGNAADVCRKEAESEHVAAKADVLLDEKTAAANAVARRQSAEASATARDKTLSANKDADDAKRSAAFAVDKAKCEAYSGDTRDACIEKAKMRHGQG